LEIKKTNNKEHEEKRKKTLYFMLFYKNKKSIKVELNIHIHTLTHIHTYRTHVVIKVEKKMKIIEVSNETKKVFSLIFFFFIL
jgi:hypothetical protein